MSRGREATRRGRWGAVGLAAWTISCGAPPEPKPVQQRDAGTYVRRIGTVWGEVTRHEGFLENDPNGITSFRVQTDVKITLGQGSSATETIRREEEFETRTGEVFHCVAQGTVPGEARFTWVAGEVHVTIEKAAGRLPRSCKEPGFPSRVKETPSGVTEFVLRSERLVAIAPARARNVLLPLQ
jgi:hypothetical protein